MVILIQSFLDYFKSSRTISIVASLKESSILTPYATAIPLVLGTIILLPLVFNNKFKDEKIIKLILLAFLSIPLIISLRMR